MVLGKAKHVSKNEHYRICQSVNLMEKLNKSVAGKPLLPSPLFSMAGTYPIEAPFKSRLGQ
jgi:hypothetical protein